MGFNVERSEHNNPEAISNQQPLTKKKNTFLQRSLTGNEYIPHFRADPISAVDFKYKTNSMIFVEYFSNNALCVFFLTLQVLCLHVIVSHIVILWSFCVNRSVCLYICLCFLCFFFGSFLLSVCLVVALSPVFW